MQIDANTAFFIAINGGVLLVFGGLIFMTVCAYFDTATWIMTWTKRLKEVLTIPLNTYRGI